MEVFVGTSGWYYEWNPDRSLDWYIENSRLNAVELNASYYRFPFPNQVKAWRRKGSGLRWAVKVNRLVTHVHKLGSRAPAVWQRFQTLFEPLDQLVDFYLFQLPPNLSAGKAEQVRGFARKTGLGCRFALECRHPSWFETGTADWAKKLGITMVSVDAPELSREVFNTSGLVYLRMHGRTAWYRHDYRPTELRDVGRRISAARPRASYVFFNNDEAMLANARAMLASLKRRSRARATTH